MIPLNILITAGPTREAIDSVRFISNHSTGTMGYAIAQKAFKKGYTVTLISGPVGIRPPANVKPIYVQTAREMFRAVKQQMKSHNCLVMSAAVSDFRPVIRHSKKIKKTRTARAIRVTHNPDILAWAGQHKRGCIIVGFCMETERLLQRAKEKQRLKNADLMVANRIYKARTPFGAGPADFIILDAGQQAMRLDNVSKDHVAAILLDKIEKLWYKKHSAQHGTAKRQAFQE